MEKAVNDWFKNKGDTLDDNVVNYELKPFNVIVDIPYQTILNYTRKDPLKRHQVAILVGPHPILDSPNTKFTTNISH